MIWTDPADPGVERAGGLEAKSGEEVTTTRMVGQNRLDVVAHLVRVFDEVARSSGPRVEAIVAPVGWGKTKIVHEFYRELAQHRQSNPAYWPDLIDGDSLGTEPLAHRKRTHPTSIRLNPKATIDFLWWGLLCHRRADGRLAQVLTDDATQLYEHSVAIEARSNGRLRRVLQQGGIDTLDGVYARGSLVVDLLAVFGLAFPPLAWGKLVTDMAREGYAAAVRWSGTRNERLDKSYRRLDVDDEHRAAFVDALAERIVALSRQLPIVLNVDDAHDADPSLLRFVSAVAHQPDARVLVLFSTWPDQVDHVDGLFGGWLAELSDSAYGVTNVTRLAAMSTEELSQIVLTLAPQTPRSTAQQLARRFAPNPFALRQALTFGVVRRHTRDGAIRLPREEIARLPSDLSDQYRRKWDELPSEVQEALAISSWQGRDFLSRASVRAAKAIAIESAAEAILRAEAPYAWTRTLDEWVRSFTEPDLRELALSDADRLFTQDEARSARHALGSYLLQLQQDKNRWAEVSDFGRRSTLEALLALDGTGFSLMDDARAAISLDLARAYESRLEYSEAVATLEPLESDLPDDPRLATLVIRSLARLRAATGPIDRALRTLERLNDLALIDADVDIELDRCEYLGDAGDYRQALGRLDELPETLDPGQTVRAAALEARLLAEMGKFREALDALEPFVNRSSEIFGPNSPEHVHLLNNLSWFSSRIGDNDRALRLAEDATRRILETVGRTHPEALESLNNVARFRHRQGDTAGAIAVGRDVLDGRMQTLGSEHHKTLTSMDNLATYLIAANELEEALSLVEGAISVWKTTHQLRHQRALAPLRNKATVLARLGRPSETRAAALEAVSVATAVLEPGHPNLVRVLVAAAEALWTIGDDREARPLAERASAMADRHLRADHPERREADALVESMSGT